MKVERIQSGLARFIDREVVPSLSGWDKVLVGAGGGLLAARIPEIMKQYAEHPVVSALGVYDEESGEIDIDRLYEAVQPYIGTEPLPIKLPFVGITIKMTKRELDSLYAYIREG